ncbi:hypothetical protein BWQ93_01590 [Sphingopyxis sp. QXT-31]|uniref:Rap1a/Tai family immunity protein n=1 Tax=Sphingopyxis sp. QXT-31 TaxID=1357916 RepID=UPI0009791D17|nr:Rap1a/Tai family immunity protein [Sphingopyxis sp. QXT-31]APZ97327.1 hypothetical protein BWQ93_01590 [Sphingopyxis sp. QXT-31]
MRSLFGYGALAILAAGAMHIPAPASAAGFKSGNDLWEDCRVSERDAEYFTRIGRCTAYIAGAADSLLMVSAFNKGSFCLPANVTLGQLTDVVAGYLRDNPAKRHMSASLLVGEAVLASFKCT